MTDQLWMLDSKGIERTRETNRRVLGSLPRAPQRRRRVNGGGSAAAGGCEPQNAIIQLTIIGKPTGGTLTVYFSVNASVEPITLNWNDSAGTVGASIIAAHSQIATGDISVSGGPFPNANIFIEFVANYENTDIPLPYCSWTTLTGGSGVAILPSYAQRGHAA